MKKEQPDLPFGQVGKQLGEEWKAMSDAKKKKFNAEAEKLKAGAYPLLLFRTDCTRYRLYCRCRRW